MVKGGTFVCVTGIDIIDLGTALKFKSIIIINFAQNQQNLALRLKHKKNKKIRRFAPKVI